MSKDSSQEKSIQIVSLQSKRKRDITSTNWKCQRVRDQPLGHQSGKDVKSVIWSTVKSDEHL